MLWFRGISALLLLGLGLLAVFRVPHGALWKPAVGATAFGAFLIPLALPITWTGPGDAVSVLALAGAFLLATPLLRAIPAARSTQDHVEAAFGTRSWTGPAPARPAPYTLSGLLGPGSGGPDPVHHTLGGGLPMELWPGVGPGPHPVVIAIHGGSWNKGEPSQLSKAYRYLADRGITVAAITYRLAPEHTFPAQLDDVQAAIRWMRERAGELGTDPERTVLLGRSAGGHLALLGAYTTDDPGIRGVVALYPPTDMNWSWAHPTHPWILDTPKTLSEFLGGSPDQVPERYDAASPIDFVGPDSPPTLLVHGSRDELVFAEQSQRLAARLAESGVPHALVETPWDTHGLDANLGGPGGQLYLWSLERFLGAVLAG